MLNYMQKAFSGVIKVTDLEIGKLSYIIQVGPIWSLEFLNAENFLWLKSEKMQQKSESKKEGLNLLLLV